jgi:hypothetical protein
VTEVIQYTSTFFLYQVVMSTVWIFRWINRGAQSSNCKIYLKSGSQCAFVRLCITLLYDYDTHKISMMLTGSVMSRLSKKMVGCIVSEFQSYKRGFFGINYFQLPSLFRNCAGRIDTTNQNAFSLRQFRTIKSSLIVPIIIFKQKSWRKQTK